MEQRVRRFLMPMMVAALMLIAGCRSSAPSESNSDDRKAASSGKCSEPENPYDEGTGHYAGYEWAQSNGTGTCGGNSQSFTEGCEEYENQEAEYEQCEAKRSD
jgi:hypothetical protein